MNLYIEPATRVHRLHPVTKLIVMVSLFFAAFLSDRPLPQLPLAGMLGALLVAVGAWVNVVRLRLLFVMVATMTFVVWVVFYGRGAPWLNLGPIHASREAIDFAAAMALKLVTFLEIGLLFLSTTTVEELAYALVRLGVPFKFGFTLTLAFRLVPAFVDSALTVVQAQRSRGFDFDRGGPIERVRRYVPVLVPVFISALRRADGMAIALEARGFQRSEPRSSFIEHAITRLDALSIATAVAIGGAYTYLWMAGALAPLRLT